MNLKETGTPSPLQMYKESTERKGKIDKKKLVVKFILIFILSHIGRSLILRPNKTIIADQKIINKDHVLIRLTVKSLVPKGQSIVNLLQIKSLKEIESVEIIEREISDDGKVQVLLGVPKDKSSWVIENPNDWQLIPLRKVSTKKKRSYEVSF